MNLIAGWWADALLRASIQGGVAVLLLWSVLKIARNLPPSLQVWAWRLILLKFFLTLVAPISVEKGRVMSGAGPAQPSLLPLFILILSVICLVLAIGMVIREFFTIFQLRRHDSRHLEFVQNGKVEVRECRSVDIPMLIGFGRPLVLVPHGFAKEHPDEYRMAVEHEVAHWRRHDLAWAWLTYAAKAIFFFHPLISLAVKELTVATEAACDETAIQKSSASRKAYGLLLIKLSQGKGQPDYSSVAFASACSEGTLSRRVKLLAEPKRGATLLPCLGLIIFSIALLPSFRFISKARETPGSSSPKVYSPAAMASGNNDFERRNFAQKNPQEGKQ